MDNRDEFYMRKALGQAKLAAAQDEVPVGAVIVKGDQVLAVARNRKHTSGNPLDHAEVIAIKKAVKKLGDWHLNDCELFVTLEPCPMCAGACINARLGRVVFGAFDKKAGCCGTLYNLPEDVRFNHRPQVTGGIMEKECGGVLSEYFKNKRMSKKEGNI